MDPTFLHAQYVENRLSAEEVAALCFSSKSTILKHLKLAGIPIREPNPGVRRRRCLAYGQTMRARLVVIDEREARALGKMRDLRSKGFTYEAIAEVMNSMKVRTKTGRGRWHRKTVQAMLNRRH
jgi:hypothetical protein